MIVSFVLTFAVFLSVAAGVFIGCVLYEIDRRYPIMARVMAGIIAFGGMWAVMYAIIHGKV